MIEFPWSIIVCCHCNPEGYLCPLCGEQHDICFIFQFQPESFWQNDKKLEHKPGVTRIFDRNLGWSAQNITLFHQNQNQMILEILPTWSTRPLGVVHILRNRESRTLGNL